MTNYSKKRCIPYYRVSTDDQAERYSLGIQQQLMEQWATLNNAILDRPFIDDHSAKDFHRPGFTKMMEYVLINNSIIDFILVIDWSRFSRNITESYIKINELEKLGVGVQAIEQMIDDTIPESTIMKAIFLAAPDAENKRRSINVIKGMRQSLRSGNWCAGKPPRGYWRDRNSNEILPSSEGELIGIAYCRIARSGYSIKEAQAFLKNRGYEVGFKSLSKMLRNPFYKGSIKHALLGNEIVKGNHKPVVSPSDWEKVQQIISVNNKKGKAEDLFPLKGFLSCVKCRKSFTGYQVKKKQKADGTYRIKKSQPVYYKCSCSNVSGKALHDAFVKLLDTISPDPNLQSEFKETLVQTYSRLSDHHLSDAVRLKSEKTKLNTFLAKLELKFINGEIDKKSFARHKRATNEKLKFIDQEINEVSKSFNSENFVDFSENIVTGLQNVWLQSSIRGKRRIQTLIFPEGLHFDKSTWSFEMPSINKSFQYETSRSE